MSTIINATTTNGVVIQPDNSGSLVLQTNNGTTALTISTAQNVGIGTASPVEKLQVKGNVRTDDPAGGSNHYEFGTDSTGGYIYTNQATAFQFWTNNAERMRIDSSGNVLVGTTSQVGSGLICAVGDAAAVNPITIKNTGSAAASNRYFAYFINSSNAMAGGIAHTASTTTAYTTSSDYRLKENIVPMTGALDKVALLKPVTYTWKSDGLDGQGFIAHELQAVVPDAVVGEKDAVDEEGNIQPQSVDTSFLVATLTAAIQEMKAIIDAQSVTINDLKARVTALEAK
jgi:hypothetical protein